MQSQKHLLKLIFIVGLQALLFFNLKVSAAPITESQNETTKQVQNLDDFQYHIILHRARVVRLALFLYDSLPEQFATLDRESIEQFISLHDESKLSDPNITNNLYQFYGHDISESEQLKIQLLELKIKLNKIDAIHAISFFSKRGMYSVKNGFSPEALLLLNLEKVADDVDRGENPISKEEFGRDLIPASRFLKDPKLIEWSLFLEKNYKSLTADLWFAAVGSCKRLFR